MPKIQKSILGRGSQGTPESTLLVLALADDVVTTVRFTE
jgi:hypothetical protein